MGRDLLGHKAQFLSLFLISLLAVGFYTGITAEYRGMELSGRDFFEETNLATLWVFGEDFTEDELEAVAALEDVEQVERLLLYETQARLPDAPALTVRYREGDEINRLLVWEGAAFVPDDERIWLDLRFAEARGLTVGDSLSFTVAGTSVDAQIAGLVYSPELVYPELGDSLSPDYGAHGHVFTGIGNLPQPDAAALAEAAATLSATTATQGDATQAAGTEGAALGSRGFQPPFNQLVVYAPAAIEHQYSLEEDVEGVLGSRAATILVQENHPTASTLWAECEQHAIFANAFPVLFMFIAVLVMLSTMSRLVSKQATLIGTMKALGVQRGAIAAHYVGYGFLIMLAGGLLGAALGPPFVPELFKPSITRFFTLPYWQTYREPFFFILPFVIALAGALVSWLSSRRILAQAPAEAMRPRAPREARHSPLEALPFWKRLSPSLQLTERDMRRNKLRSVMSVVSSMGVSALLLVAFLSWSIMDEMVSWQYSTINNFASRATLAEDGDAGELRRLTERYEALPLMEQAIEIRLPASPASKVTGTLQAFESTGPEGGEAAGNGSEAGEAENEALLRVTDPERRIRSLEDDQVLMSYGVARNLGLGVGERFEWHRYGEGGWHEATVDAINRNPLVWGLTMTPDTLEGFGIDFEPTALLSARMIAADEAGVQSVVSAEEISAGMDLMLEAMVMMASVMIAVAVLISIFTLYNLSTLTFSEMERELATLKVVGFKRRQIVMLLFAQNLILSVLGFIPGIPLGWKIADLMFNAQGGTLDMATLLIPSDVLLTLAVVWGLCAVVALLFIRKVARLDMVGSLKAPE
jgi:putative ABC transport system permease protein